jgi:hypothetical protein
MKKIDISSRSHMLLILNKIDVARQTTQDKIETQWPFLKPHLKCKNT